MSRLLVALCGALFGATAVSAAEIRSIDVQYEDGLYTLASEVWFDVGLEELYYVFSRWDLSTQFSSAIVEARDLEPDGSGRPGFFVVNRGCMLFFCKTLTRQGYVEQERNRILRALADPALSDFRVSDETWDFSREAAGTLVKYQLLMQPDFWVPPLIGPYVIKRKLASDGSRALDRIEVIATDLAQRGEVH